MIPRAGELVTVAAQGRQRDGIVVTIPSANKVIVAVTDPARGPVLRTFPPEWLEAREQAGPDDEALQRLIRRTPSAAGGSKHGGPAGSGRGASAHTRGAAHRATGR
jgi:hypothetical protein